MTGKGQPGRMSAFTQLLRGNRLSWRGILVRLLGPALFVGILYFFIDLQQLRAVFRDADPGWFVLSILLVPVLVLVRSRRWVRILDHQQIPLDRRRAFSIYFVGLLTANAASAVGSFIRALYLHKQGFGLARPVLSVVIDKYLDCIILAAMGGFSLLLIAADLPPWLSLFLLLAVSLAAYVPVREFLAHGTSLVARGKIKRIAFSEEFSREQIRAELRRCIDLKVYGLSLLSTLLYFFIIYLVCRSLVIDLSFVDVILIESATVLVTLIPISVLGLGTRDVSLLAVFELFGRTPEQAIALSMALLLMRVIIILMGAFFWFADPPPFEHLKALRNRPL